MPSWGWGLLTWAVVATACAVWWGLALANADTQDKARRMAEESSPQSNSRTDA